MSNDFFKFQKFTIRQRQSAMKVGTDGCLLGALSRGGEHILDIGTGTGLVALMMAQRFPNANIKAIDIDEQATTEAKENFNNSPFNSRLDCKRISLQEFTTSSLSDIFDSIVSNPPYFSNSLKNPDKQKSTARHNDELSFRQLCECAYKLLQDNGTFTVIIPTEALTSFTAEACINGFILKSHIAIRTVTHKAPQRHILEFVKEPVAETHHEEHYIMDSDNKRSEWYSEIMKDFYLTNTKKS